MIGRVIKAEKENPKNVGHLSNEVAEQVRKGIGRNCRIRIYVTQYNKT